MYNSVKELHIGLDIALQNINSSRKQIIKPEEKDWVLNEVMYQLINNVVDPNPRLSRNYYEVDQKAIDMLESLKVNSQPYLPILNDTKYGYGYTYLPKDYLKATELKALIINNDAIATQHNINYYLLPIPDVASLASYTDTFTIKLGTFDLFDVSKVIETKKVYDFTALNKQDSKYLVVNAAIESLNSFKGIEAYWSKHSDIKQPFSIIVKVDTGNIDSTILDEYPAASVADITINIGTYSKIVSLVNLATYNKYQATYEKLVTCRIVKSDIEGDIENHYYAKSIINSPVVTFGNNKLKVKLPVSNTYKLVAIIPEYYRKPLSINHRTNQGCEIQSPDFNNDLVNKAAQKIAARIQDKAYPNIINENALLE
jgi:hypothetical protein